VPLEYIAIVGLTIGGFVAGNDIKVIKATIGALPSIFKGRSSTRRLRRSAGHALRGAGQGAQGRPDVDRERRRESARQPDLQQVSGDSHDHHVMEFITDYLRMMVGGNLNASRSRT
jgi:chemotaxis protein MotA